MSSVVGLGVDIVDVAQLRDLLDGRTGTSFLLATFTDAELDHADGDPLRLASLFAAKEAAFKAFRTGWIEGHLVEVLHAENGAPALQVHGPLRELAAQWCVTEFWVSLSGTPSLAVAVVLLCR